MKSDFARACQHLEEAFRLLGGADEASAQARETLARVIDAVTFEQHARSRPQADILVFPARMGRDRLLADRTQVRTR